MGQGHITSDGDIEVKQMAFAVQLVINDASRVPVPVPGQGKTQSTVAQRRR